MHASVDRSGQNCYSAGFIPAPQHRRTSAASHAPTTSHASRRVAHLAVRHSTKKAELPKAGFKKLSNVKGAFYIYADIHNLTNDSEEFCRRMLGEARVSMTPGLDFDVARGHTTVRICFADDTNDIIEACRRLQAWQK